MKAYKPSTSQDAISRTRHLQDLVPKNKFLVKKNFPIIDKDKKPFLQECPKKNWVDDDPRKELRRKKLCFTCQEPWIPGHKCAGKVKGHYIEVYSNSEEDEPEQETTKELRIEEDESL